eukprot:TRINITY_DN112542_c0_g1_i1.p1 TRINITY_DN112542_c0_g1~~TRINITY_DN112542_c0_g1_i1.p1  ORF type:complete len:235 (-),score=32.73 TRINITY_DN112542_c0_g1_i1:172-822(-)
MGISRNSRHKHRLTGGRMPVHKKKRKFELGRPPAATKIGTKRVRPVRCRGGNMKYRALRLDHGNFSWGTEGVTFPTRILDVVYNASNNELVRTKTLVKNAIVIIDATPFKTWFHNHYGMDIGKKKRGKEEDVSAAEKPVKKSRHVLSNQKHRKAEYLTAHSKRDGAEHILDDDFASGRVIASIASRPGQSGRADGYILEGAELSFYKRKLEKKKKN